MARTPCVVFRIPAQCIPRLVEFSFNIANAFRAVTMASLASHYRRHFRLHTEKSSDPITVRLHPGDLCCAVFLPCAESARAQSPLC